MNARLFSSLILVVLGATAYAQDFLDRVDDALTFSALRDRARARLSGTIDLEYYHIDEPPFGLVNSTANNLFNPRLTLFLDAQLGARVYAFAQARVDRGFDPSDNGARIRLDEYAVRFTPWEDGRFSMQVGKFSPVVGNWMGRHLSWDNSFVTAPLPYENLTEVSDLEPPGSAVEFRRARRGATSYEDNPVIWGANYTTGASVSARLGKFEIAAEVKNAALSSRPASWDATEIGFEHPTFNAHLGWRPTLAWNFGLSASRGAYLRPEAAPHLPRGRNIGDYQELVLGQDIGFASGHFQLWAEFYEVRFEVPHVGNAGTFAYYVEGKYKFRPDLFAALRWNQQLFTDVANGRDGETAWGNDVLRVDAALGYRFTPHAQLKVQYSIEKENGPRGQSHALAVQFTVRF